MGGGGAVGGGVEGRGGRRESRYFLRDSSFNFAKRGHNNITFLNPCIAE